MSNAFALLGLPRIAALDTEALQQAWLASQQLLGNEETQVQLLDGATEWQVYFFQGNSWANAQSTGNVAAPPAGAASGVAPRAALPSGVPA